MDPLREPPRRNPYGAPVNRAHSPVLASGLPWITIIAASVVQIMPVASAIPLSPPLGFLMLLCWRLVRPGLLPVWAGFPLGLVDDLFSGQPFGSAILLWSVAMLVIELVESRLPWREFRLDWLFAVALIAGYLLLAAMLSGGKPGWPVLLALLVQFAFSCLLYPGLARMVGWLDRFRLLRFREIS